jgi:hypothetical protein
VLSLLVAAGAAAETRRALVVGIDHYTRPDKSRPVVVSAETRARLAKIHGKPSRTEIADLEGAVNDAAQVRDLLIHKYGFAEKNIVFLKDDAATADHILDTLQKHLVDEARPGDVSFFYYAGHGSRIRNTLTANSSGMDSTLVPADTLLGVPDIRSKELVRIYLGARKKKVELTVVQDSCFSGTGTRGPRPGGRVRAADPDNGQSVSEAAEGPLPEQQGVLFFSASQEYQAAQEVQDDRMGRHGAFTWGLLQVLASSGNDERVDRIFQRTRALMQSKVENQEPVLLGSAGREQRGLFGQAADPFGAAAAAVGYVDAKSGMLELNSGITMGLAPGTELKRIRPTSPPARIRVTEVNGPSSSNAAAVAPTVIGAIHAGDLFQVDRLVVPDKEFLKVYVGEPAPSARVSEAARLVANLRGDSRIEWIEDPTEHTPTHVVLWNGMRWSLRENRGSGAELPTPADLSADDVLKLLVGRTPKARVAVLLPPTTELIAGLTFSSRGNIVSITKSITDAGYFLAGRAATSGEIEYAWARPSVTQEDIDGAHGEHHQRQSATLAVWPLRSDWHAAKDVARLTNDGLNLAHVAGWLQLQTPVPDDAFPYHLVLRDQKGPLSDGELTGGHTYELLLRREDGALKRTVPPRRVYVFVVDSFGMGTLVYPKGNVDNEFPPKRTTTLPVEIDLKQPVDIQEPWGTDNYYLLTSVQPIDNAGAVFNFEGVRSRGTPGRGPLEKLIENRSAGARGALSGVPTNWSIERTAFRSEQMGH